VFNAHQISINKYCHCNIKRNSNEHKIDYTININNGEKKKLAKNNLNRIQSIINVYDEYKIHKSLIQCLKIVGMSDR